MATTRSNPSDWERYQHHILAELDRLSTVMVEDHDGQQRLHGEVALLKQLVTRLAEDQHKMSDLRSEVALLKQAHASKTMVWLALIGGVSGALTAVGAVLAAYFQGP